MQAITKEGKQICVVRYPSWGLSHYSLPLNYSPHCGLFTMMGSIGFLTTKLGGIMTVTPIKITQRWSKGKQQILPELPKSIKSWTRALDAMPKGKGLDVYLNYRLKLDGNLFICIPYLKPVRKNIKHKGIKITRYCMGDKKIQKLSLRKLNCSVNI